MRLRSWSGLVLLTSLACTVGGGGGTFGSGSAEGTSSTGDPGTADSAELTADSSDGSVSSSGGDEAAKFDLHEGPAGPCAVGDDLDAPGACRDVAPPDSFEPDVQWAWTGPRGLTECTVIPLVANLTDDNGDGSVDLCDTPDIVVVVSEKDGGSVGGSLFVLDGASGSVHYEVPDVVASTTPALGDIDDDGLPEIVAARRVESTLRTIALEHDGTLAWAANGCAGVGSSYALADLDADGDVEIIHGQSVCDAMGAPLFAVGDSPGPYSATTAADLDDDGVLEVVLGRSAFHSDGSEYWRVATLLSGFPQVANLDDDPRPEVLLTNADGITVLEHDGTIKYANLTPGGDPSADWVRPATIHDMDGDGRAEYALSAGNDYTVYRRDASVMWSAVVSDLTGRAAGTAFDFLGDGSAEAMYGDEWFLFVFDEAGAPLLEVPRTSRTLTEYPVVADVDDDGSAEVVVVANYVHLLDPPAPTVQVIRDVDDRWIQARRIWNQHTYHVTNVREDGTIPMVEPPHWRHLNTFRTNAQIEGGSVCDPEPEG